ncbi:MAG: 2,3-bisphosphoglycerate-independent phosphoglycerate mutase, partial [Bacteroidales bacterium]|nr:2,3-bisphosphoglycerate-independent phosphoglycerate mutase [Bacteroidales bacterium]
MGKKVLLIIMDGWGEGDKSVSDLIYNTPTPFIDSLRESSAFSELLCSGEDVGLPNGQMGNSEVGHLNMGAGRVVYQDFVKINKAVEDNSIKDNKAIKDAFNYALKNNKNLHFFGLVSDGGVHSSTKHLMKLCDIAAESGLKNVFIHAFTDGRDTDPQSGLGYVKELDAHLKKSIGKIATVCGRYYAMDRDKRWERVKIAYDMLVYGIGSQFKCPLQAIKDSYNEGVTDEFIKPVVITDDSGKPIALVQDGDVVICFNFRSDRLREITTVLTQKDFPEFQMKTMPLHYLTMTRYDEAFKNIIVIFDKEDVKMTLGEVLALNNKSQIRIAETEKYPHVTFFFSGGRETPFENEKRILVQSPKVATYDLKPSMSALELKDALITELDKECADFICLNFANADMVGHTGVPDAIREAVATVDSCVQEVTLKALSKGYSVIITADHGNAEYAINPDGSPNTAHSNNPVPCFLLDKDFKELSNGKLADLAPTILRLMGIKSPVEMTGKVLLKE